jgi:hypothetical protein
MMTGVSEEKVNPYGRLMEALSFCLELPAAGEPAGRGKEVAHA